MFDMSKGLCKGYPTEWWFPHLPPGHDRVLVRQIKATAEKAKVICRMCPVQAGCLKFAQDNKEEFGIWGGLDEKERGFGRIRRKAQVD